MTEQEAALWLESELGVSRETMDALKTFVAFLKREASSQNLISASTLDHIWARHIVDSAQLLQFLDHAPADTRWLDLGSGAGFPGLIIALLTDYNVTLVESRARRIDYLQRAVEMLDLTHRVHVAGVALERLETAPYSVISARAFAPYFFAKAFAQIRRATLPITAYSGSIPFEKKNDRLGPKSLMSIPLLK